MLLASALVAAAFVGSAQQRPPTFRAGVEAVVVDVSVLDKDRHPVRGLTATDFTVLEDGKPQSITTFSAVDLPGRVAPQPASWLRDVPSDVVTNTVPTDGRVVVLVLDDLVAMAPGEAVRARDLATAAIDGLGPLDVAAILFTSGRVAGQNFTAEHARLKAAVTRYVPRMNRDFDAWDPSSEPAFSAVTAMIRNLVDRLADLGHRRKTLLWIGAGIPMSFGPIPGGDPVADQLRERWVQVFAAAGRANVNIYGLDPGGLRGQAQDLHAGPTAWTDTGSTGPATVIPAAREAGRANRRFLEDVSANTGGFAVTGNNDPGPGLAQIFAETGSYYLLGYQSSNAPTKDMRHSLLVRVNQPGLTVRSRTAYSAEPAVPPAISTSAPSLVADALKALLPVRDVGLRVAAAPFLAADQGRPTIAVVLGVDQATPPRQAVTTDNVEVVVSASTALGEAAGSVTTHVKVGLPAGSGNVQYEVLTPINLKPGHYDLRVAAASTFAPKAGSVTCEVDVPDFAAAHLSLSGVVLSVTPGLAAVPPNALRSFLPVVPTSRRHFRPDEKVAALVRAYQGGKTALSPVALAVTIVDSQNVAVFRARGTLGLERFAKDRTADYRLDLPITRLAAGPYLLTIDATLGRDASRRTVRFDVH